VGNDITEDPAAALVKLAEALRQDAPPLADVPFSLTPTIERVRPMPQKGLFDGDSECDG
jgi:hypothetical protein